MIKAWNLGLLWRRRRNEAEVFPLSDKRPALRQVTSVGSAAATTRRHRQNLLDLAKLQMESQLLRRMPHQPTPESQRLPRQCLPAQRQMIGKLLLPPAFLRPSNFGEICQPLGDFGVKFLLQKRHQLLTNAVSGVVKVGVAGVLSPSLPNSRQIAFDFLAAHLQQRPEDRPRRFLATHRTWQGRLNAAQSARSCPANQSQ